MSSFGRIVIVALGAAAFGLMGVLLGAWWAPFIGGIAAGVFIPRGWWAVLGGAVAGLIAWAIPLEYAQLQYGLAKTALSLAAIMGFNGAATIPIALTLLVGTLLGFSGAWFGSVARSFYPASASINRARLTSRAPSTAAPKTPVTSKRRN